RECSYQARNAAILGAVASPNDQATVLVPFTAEAAELDLQTHTPFVAPCQFAALGSDGLIGELTPDGDGERAQLLATTHDGRTILQDTFWVVAGAGDPTTGPWCCPGTVEVGATLRRPTDIGGVPIERIFPYSLLWATN